MSSFKNVPKSNDPPTDITITKPHDRARRLLHLRLEHKMISEKIYTNKNLTLYELAHQLQTNSSYLSAHINKQFNCNFNSFLNSYRIQEACDVIKNDELDQLSIDQIADRVGFSSKRAFYAAFKKETGCTPAQYKREQYIEALSVV